MNTFVFWFFVELYELFKKFGKGWVGKLVITLFCLLLFLLGFMLVLIQTNIAVIPFSFSLIALSLVIFIKTVLLNR